MLVKMLEKPAFPNKSCSVILSNSLPWQNYNMITVRMESKTCRIRNSLAVPAMIPTFPLLNTCKVGFLIYNCHDCNKLTTSNNDSEILVIRLIQWIKKNHENKAGGYQVKSVLSPTLVNTDFLTWLLIGWRLCCQPIRCQVWKSLLTNMDFNMEIS